MGSTRSAPFEPGRETGAAPPRVDTPAGAAADPRRRRAATPPDPALADSLGPRRSGAPTMPHDPAPDPHDDHGLRRPAEAPLDAARVGRALAALDAPARWPRLARRVSIEPDARLVVSLSGGADSVLLLALAAGAARKGRVTAVHVAHGLRGEESRGDADFCARLCMALGVPLVRAAAPIDPDAPGVEAAARRARYASLGTAARASGARVVATGHHADDALETLLMRWMRGTELSGLAGLKARGPLPSGAPEDADLVVVRPLIDWRREEVRALLRAIDLPWREDSSNADARFTRNRVRGDLLPLLQEHCGDDGVANLFAFAATVEEFEGRLAERTAPLAWDPPAYAAARRGAHDAHLGGSLARGALLRLPPTLRRRALWRLLTEGAGRAPSPTALDGVLADLGAGRCRAHDLGGGWRLQLRSDRLHLTPPAARLASPFDDAAHQLRFPYGAGVAEARPLSVPGALRLADGRAITAERVELSPGAPVPRALTAVELDEAELDGPLFVRFARDGDRFHPLGAPGARPLGRFLRDVGIPREERARVPLVFAGDRLVWVAGVRPSDAARVTARTRTRVRLELSGAADDARGARPAAGSLPEAPSR